MEANHDRRVEQRQPGSEGRLVRFALGQGGSAGKRQSDDPREGARSLKLIRTGEVVSLGMPYDTRMPIAPGRAYALRMPGGPTGGPYGGKSRTIWNDEFIATEIGQIGTQMDALGHLGCMCGGLGDKTNMLFCNGNRLSDMWSPYGLKKLGIEKAPPFLTPRRPVRRPRPQGTGARHRRRDRAPRPKLASSVRVCPMKR